MSNYYSKQEAKVRIAHELMKRGWKVLYQWDNENGEWKRNDFKSLILNREA